jgi:ketosteroid isomerase-like protein
MSNTEEIRALLTERVAALGRRDATAANAILDDDLVAFEVSGSLQVSSAQARGVASTQLWLDSFEEGPNISMEELTIVDGGTAAFCHSINHLQGRRHDGQAVDVRMRSSLGFCKRDGHWKIVHAHTSFPR